MKRKRLDKAISSLAETIPGGELLACTDPAMFLETIKQKILTLELSRQSLIVAAEMALNALEKQINLPLNKTELIHDIIAAAKEHQNEA